MKFLAFNDWRIQPIERIRQIIHIENPDLTIKIEAQSMFDLTEGKMSMIGLFLRRKLKIKPFFKIFSAYKIFSKIF